MAMLPVLERVAVCAALVVLTSWMGNARAVGATPAIGAIPVPESVAVSVGFTGSLLVTTTVAARALMTVGVNVTLMVQLVAAARLAPQLLVWAKSPGLAPPSAIVKVSSVLPVLESVSGCDGLV